MNILSWPGIVMALGALLYLLVPPPLALGGAARKAEMCDRLKTLGLVMIAAGLLVLLLRSDSRALVDL